MLTAFSIGPVHRRRKTVAASWPLKIRPWPFCRNGHDERPLSAV